MQSPSHGASGLLRAADAGTAAGPWEARRVLEEPRCARAHSPPSIHTCIQRKPILAPSLNEYLDRPSSSSSSSPPSPQRKHAARSPYAGHYSEPLACSSGSPEPPQLHLHKRRRGTEMSTSLPKAAPPAVASEPRSPSS